MSFSFSAMVRKLGTFFAVLASAALVAGCGAGSRGGSIPYDVSNFGVPDAPSTTTPVGADYQIAPLDTLAIAVYLEEDLSGDFQVDLAGNINMPLIGGVRAIDLTTVQLQDQLRQRLAKVLREPDVSVAIKASSRSNVTVDGAVRQPGVFPVSGPTTLMQAVALARGTSEDANPRRVAVFRQTQGQRMAAAFDLVDIRRGEAKDPVIYTGDIIIVDGSANRAMYKQLLQTLPIFAIFRPF